MYLYIKISWLWLQMYVHENGLVFYIYHTDGSGQHYTKSVFL